MTNTEYSNKLEKFFSELLYRYSVAREIKNNMDRYLASDFNFFDIFNIEELTLSKIIALILDPYGNHGQKSIFLHKFLELLEIDSLSEYINNVKIITEASTFTGRRIDILLEFPDGIKIGIENKPWAGDQENQLKEYANYLEKMTNGNFYLIFLGGDRKIPSENSISKKDRETLEKKRKLICAGYRDFLIPWLKECVKECEADKVRWFIKDFIIWLENNFPEGDENE